MDIDLSPFVENWQFLLRAIGVTLWLSAFSILLGCAIGIVCGTLRTYGGRLLDTLIGPYVDITPPLPLLALLVWTYFAFPLLIQHSPGPVLPGVLPLRRHLHAHC